MKLSIILEGKAKSAVAVVECRGKILLGQSTAKDDRKGLWCFPGGHSRAKEPLDRTATREAYEETGIRCRIAAGPVKVSDKPNVEFYHCKTSNWDTPKPNKEFNAMGWFTIRELRGLKLHPNVRQLVAKFDIS